MKAPIACAIGAFMASGLVVETSTEFDELLANASSDSGGEGRAGQAHDPAPDAAALLGVTAIAFEGQDLGLEVLGVDRVEAELRGDVAQALYEAGEGSGVDAAARVDRRAVVNRAR